MQPSSSAPAFSAWCPSALPPALRRRSWSATALLFVPGCRRCRELRRVAVLRQRRHGARPHLPSSSPCTGRHQSARRSRRRQGSPSTSSPTATTCGEGGYNSRRLPGRRRGCLRRFDVVQMGDGCEVWQPDLGLSLRDLVGDVLARARFAEVAVRRCRCRVVLDGAENRCRVRWPVQRGRAEDVHVKSAPTYFLRTVFPPAFPEAAGFVGVVPGVTIAFPLHVFDVWE